MVSLRLPVRTVNRTRGSYAAGIPTVARGRRPSHRSHKITQKYDAAWRNAVPATETFGCTCQSKAGNLLATRSDTVHGGVSRHFEGHTHRTTTV